MSFLSGLFKSSPSPSVAWKEEFIKEHNIDIHEKKFNFVEVDYWFSNLLIYKDKDKQQLHFIPVFSDSDGKFVGLDFFFLDGNPKKYQSKEDLLKGILTDKDKFKENDQILSKTISKQSQENKDKFQNFQSIIQKMAPFSVMKEEKAEEEEKEKEEDNCFILKFSKSSFLNFDKLTILEKVKEGETKKIFDFSFSDQESPFDVKFDNLNNCNFSGKKVRSEYQCFDPKNTFFDWQVNQEHIQWGVNNCSFFTIKNYRTWVVVFPLEKNQKASYIQVLLLKKGDGEKQNIKIIPCCSIRNGKKKELTMEDFSKEFSLMFLTKEILQFLQRFVPAWVKSVQTRTSSVCAFISDQDQKNIEKSIFREYEENVTFLPSSSYSFIRDETLIFQKEKKSPLKELYLWTHNNETREINVFDNPTFLSFSDLLNPITKSKVNFQFSKAYLRFLKDLDPSQKEFYNQKHYLTFNHIGLAFFISWKCLDKYVIFQPQELLSFSWSIQTKKNNNIFEVSISIAEYKDGGQVKLFKSYYKENKEELNVETKNLVGMEDLQNACATKSENEKLTFSFSIENLLKLNSLWEYQNFIFQMKMSESRPTHLSFVFKFIPHYVHQKITQFITTSKQIYEKSIINLLGIWINYSEYPITSNVFSNDDAIQMIVQNQKVLKDVERVIEDPTSLVDITGPVKKLAEKLGVDPDTQELLKILKDTKGDTFADKLSAFVQHGCAEMKEMKEEEQNFRIEELQMEFKEKVEEQNKAIEELQMEFKEKVEEQNKAIEELENEVNELRLENQNLNKRLEIQTQKASEEIQKREEEVASKEEKIQTTQNLNQLLNSRNEILQQQIENFTRGITEIVEQKNNLESNVKAKEEEQVLRIDLLNTELNDQKTQNQVLQNENNLCQTKVDEKEKQIQKLSQQILTTNKQAEDQSKQINQLTDQIKNLQMQLQQFKGLIVSLQNQNQNLTTENKRLNDSFNSSQRENLKLKNDLEKALPKTSLADELALLEDEQSQMTTQKDESEKQNQISSLEQLVQEKNQLVQSLQAEQEQIITELNEIKRKSVEFEKQNNEYNAKIQKLNTDQIKLKKSLSLTNTLLQQQKQEFEENLAKINNSFEEEKKQIEEQHKEEQNEAIENLKAEVQKKSIEIEEFQTKIAIMSESSKLLETKTQEKSQTITKLEARVGLVEEQIQKLTFQKEKLQQVNNLVKKDAEAEKQKQALKISQLEGELAVQQKKSQHLELNKEQCQAEGENQKNKIEELNQQILEEKNKANSQAEQITQLTDQITDLQKQLREFKDSIVSLQNQNQNLTTKNKGLMMTEAQLEAERSLITTQKAEMQTLLEELKKINKKNVELENQNKEYNNITQQLYEKQEEKQKYEEELKKIQNSLKGEKKKHEEIEVIKNSLEREKQKLERELEAIKNSLKGEGGQHKEQLETIKNSLQATHIKNLKIKNKLLRETQNKILKMKLVIQTLTGSLEYVRTKLSQCKTDLQASKTFSEAKGTIDELKSQVESLQSEFQVEESSSVFDEDAQIDAFLKLIEEDSIEEREEEKEERTPRKKQISIVKKNNPQSWTFTSFTFITESIENAMQILEEMDFNKVFLFWDSTRNQLFAFAKTIYTSSKGVQKKLAHILELLYEETNDFSPVSYFSVRHLLQKLKFVERNTDPQSLLDRSIRPFLWKASFSNSNSIQKTPLKDFYVEWLSPSFVLTGKASTLLKWDASSLKMLQILTSSEVLKQQPSQNNKKHQNWDIAGTSFSFWWKTKLNPLLEKEWNCANFVFDHGLERFLRSKEVDPNQDWVSQKILKGGLSSSTFAYPLLPLPKMNIFVDSLLFRIFSSSSSISRPFQIFCLPFHVYLVQSPSNNQWEWKQASSMEELALFLENRFEIRFIGFSEFQNYNQNQIESWLLDEAEED